MKQSPLYIAASLFKAEGDAKAKWHPVTDPVTKLEASLAVAEQWKLGRFARVIPEKSRAVPARKPA